MSEVPQPEALAAAAAAAVNLSDKYGMGDHQYHNDSIVGEQQEQQQEEGHHNHSVDDIIKGEQEQEHHEQQEHAEQHEQQHGHGHDINEVSLSTEAAVEATTQVILTSNSAIAAANAATIPMKREHATPTATHTGRVSLLNDEDQQGKRRFFPRVKHLISNKEWEDFLSQILEYIEQAGAPNCPAASHKTDNSWYKAFDLVYNSVASDYSIPTGKNRYHKFKDKIVEVWVALEQQEGGHPGEHLCRSQAIQQLARHRKACAEAVTQRHQNSASNKRVKHEDGTTPRKSSKLNANGTPSSSSHTALGNAAALAKLISSGSKRSFSTSFGGNHGGGGGKASGIGDALGTSPDGNGHGHGHGQKKDPYWPNLAERSCLESLPQPLRQLVHLKQLSREMSAKTSNRVTKKSIDQHGKTVVDTAYLLALQEYIKSLTETEDTEEDTTTTTGNEDGGGGVAGGESQDVVMEGSSGDGSTAAAAVVVPTPSTNKAYLRATSMAFLYRYASTVEEQRVLNDEYRKYSKKYISQVSVPVSSKNDDTNAGGTAGNGTSNGTSGEGVVVVMEDGSFSTTTKKAAVNVDDVAASIKAEAAAATAMAVAETETIPTNMNANGNGNALPTSTVTAAEVEASPLTAFSV